jgi:phage shock protein B
MRNLPEVLAVLALFIGLPWLILHYITRWRTAATLTGSDEAMLEELHDLARRLDDRVATVERIMTAENPNWRALASECAPLRLETENDTNETLRRIK